MTVDLMGFDYGKDSAWSARTNYEIITDTDAKVSIVMARCSEAGAEFGIRGKFGGSDESKCEIYGEGYVKDGRGNSFHGGVRGNNQDGYEYNIGGRTSRSFEREREASRSPDSRERE